MGRMVAEEIIARQTPEAQKIIRLLLSKIANLEADWEERRRVKGVTPQNSSFPPSARHPHAKTPLWLPRV